MLNIFKEDHNTIGEPWLQIITNWVTTKGTNSYQRGATRANLLGLKSKWALP